MEKYIISLNEKLWVKSLTPELILVSSPEEAIAYDKIGEAMKDAGELNNLIGNPIIKIQKTSVQHV